MENETIDMDRVNDALEAAKRLNRAEVGMLVALLRAFNEGRESAQPKQAGRPKGSKTRRPAVVPEKGATAA